MVDLYGQIQTPPLINVYQDESGDFSSHRFCLVGLLWVDAHKADSLLKELLAVRYCEDYWGEVHFSDLAASFGGEGGKKPRVAREWLNLYIGGLYEEVNFTCLCVDTHHPKYEPERFGKDFHAYNRFTAITLNSGRIWHFKGREVIRIRILSDDKRCRRGGGVIGDGITKDNFEEYVLMRMQIDLEKARRGPRVLFVSPVEAVSVRKQRSPDSILPDEEMLQFCDTILGAVSQAVRASSEVETKKTLGLMVIPLIQDYRKRPWSFRTFSLSYFPDRRGMIYNEGPLKIVEDKRQGSLFGE